MLLLGMIHHMIIIHQNPVLPTIPLLQHSPSHYHYAPQRSRLVFASQARCHVHVLHASCGKCPTTPLLKHCTLIIIYPDPVLPTIPPLQHSPPQYLKISLQSMLATMCDVSVQFVISQTRGHSQLYDVFHHISTSW